MEEISENGFNAISNQSGNDWSKEEAEDDTDAEEVSGFVGIDVTPNEKTLSYTFDKIYVYRDIINAGSFLTLGELCEFCKYISYFIRKMAMGALNKIDPKLWPNEYEITADRFFEIFCVKENFDALFNDDKIREQAYKILVDLEIIDQDFRIKPLVNKNVFVLWLTELIKASPAIIGRKNFIEYVRLLNAKFTNLNIDRSAFSKVSHPRAEKKYGDALKKAVRKLAQLAQK